MMDKRVIYNLGDIESLKRENGFIKYYLTDELLNKIKFLDKDKKEKKLYNSLEDIYRKKKYYFFNILDELILKGIKIYGNSNFQEYIEDEFKYLLEVKTEKNRVIDLDWKNLGLENLTESLDIKSDLFFHNIPLERFKYLNDELNLERIIEFFRENNFNVVGIDNKNRENNIKVEERVGEVQEVKSKTLDMDIIELSLKEEKEFMENYDEIMGNSFEIFQESYPKFIEKNSQIRGKDRLEKFLKYLV